MSTIIQPEVTTLLTGAKREVENTPQKVLFMGQFTGGTAAAATLFPNVADATYEALFGARSQLSQMIRAFKRIAPEVQLDAITVADGVTPTAREVEITFASNAAAAGSWHVIVGSEFAHSYDVAYAAGATPTVVAAALEALIDLDTRCPFTASAAAGVVTLVANDKGLSANFYTVARTGGDTVQTCVIANSVGGLVDPAFSAALFDPAGETRYQGIVWPWADVAVPLVFIDARFNVSNLIQDGNLFTFSHNATHATIISALEGHNSQSMTMLAEKDETGSDHLGAAVPELNEVKLAQVCAIRALRLTDGAVISQYMTSSASADQFGGAALASSPLFNTRLPHTGLVPTGKGWTDAEIEAIKVAGGFVIGRNSTGTNSLVGEVRTTYKTTAAGVPDTTWKYLPYVDTASGIREYFHNNYRSRFGQSRLTLGNVIAGRDMVNPTLFRNFTQKLFADLAGKAFVLVQAGEDSRKKFSENLTIEFDLENGRVTTTMICAIVTQAREIITTITIDFDTEA